MKVFVNNKEQEVPAGSHVHMLASTLALPDKGVAIAVNNRMIPRREWTQTPLQENDHLVIIKAACGG